MSRYIAFLLVRGIDGDPVVLDLDHASGPARDIPRLLGVVAEGPDDERQKALYELWGNIWHQGTVHQATAAAVPFLARLAAQAELPLEIRGSLLYLLASIAAGSGYLERHRSLIPGWDQQDEDQMRRERAWVTAARSAVADALSTTLSNPDDFHLESAPDYSTSRNHLGPEAASWMQSTGHKLELSTEEGVILREMAERAAEGLAAPLTLSQSA